MTTENTTLPELFALRIRLLIADKEMITAKANLDLARGGKWLSDYQAQHKEIDSEIKALFENNENSLDHTNEKPSNTSSNTAGYVSADTLLENSTTRDISGWYQATKNGRSYQFVRIRFDIELSKYVLDAVGQDRKRSEEFWRYKGNDWLFLCAIDLLEAHYLTTKMNTPNHYKK